MGRKNSNVCVDEEVKIAIQRTLKRYLDNPDQGGFFVTTTILRQYFIEFSNFY